jgi:hypothetical protein
VVAAAAAVAAAKQCARLTPGLTTRPPWPKIMKRTPAEEAQYPWNAPQAFSSYSSTPESRRAAASERGPASTAANSGKSSAMARLRVSRSTHRLAAQLPRVGRHLMRRQDQRTPQRGRLLTPRADYQFQSSSDFGAELAAQRQGGRSMTLEPTRESAAAHDAWDYELPMHAALREKASRRGAVGASGASVPGRVRRARTAEV